MQQDAKALTRDEWEAFTDEGDKQRIVKKRTKIAPIYPTLLLWFIKQHPEVERATLVVSRALEATFHDGIAYRTWAIAARERLGLRFAKKAAPIKPDESEFAITIGKKAARRRGLI